MTDFRFGPIEFYLVGFEGQRPDPGVMGALTDALDSGHLRLVDLVIISRDLNGELSCIEIDGEADGLGLSGIELSVPGLAADEDIDEFAELVPVGGSAVLVAFELLWARSLASRLNRSGAVVLRSERIPAPIVNAAVDAAEKE